MTEACRIRRGRPADYDVLVAVVDAWWGREIVDALPRLFLDLFADTTWVAEDESGLAGFVVAIFPAAPEQGAYIHFVGVRPDLRRAGLARGLYALVEDEARSRDYRTLCAITAPTNESSIRFHAAGGFAVTPAVADHNGPGRPMTVFRKELAAARRPVRAGQGRDLHPGHGGLDTGTIQQMEQGSERAEAP